MPGLRVLSARGDQAEADLDFGIVGQLLRTAAGVSQPVVPREGTGPAVSSFAVGARLLEVVGEQQAMGPAAIFVDDLQWADRKSVEALTFMLRRLSVLTAEHGLSAAAIYSRRHELPLLHLAAGCVPAGRGQAEEAERHARPPRRQRPAWTTARRGCTPRWPGL